MFRSLQLSTFIIFLFLIACRDDFEKSGSRDSNFPGLIADGSFSSSFDSSSGGSGGGSGSGGSTSSGGSGNPVNDPGVITAGEWNDMENWDFLSETLEREEFTDMPSYWGIQNLHRVSVFVKDQFNRPVSNVNVELVSNDNIEWASKSDNSGMAELWIQLFEDNSTINLSDYALLINNQSTIVTDFNLFEDGINEVEISIDPGRIDRAEIAFVVDATGSMADELSYLKVELMDVIDRAKAEHPLSDFRTSSVFYRDVGDDYLTKLSPFSSHIQTTVDFINDQSAGGGGDYPEAVHTALSLSLNQLDWSESSKTRLLFLLLDAPPHYEDEVIEDMHRAINKAAEIGIKIIPITASGVNKETEFLMRFCAMATNGTYVFITDHSGIGGSHIEPTIGAYDVEFLNDLMVRLIGEYLD